MKSICLRNIKKFNFSHRTVDIWNGLSVEIVAAESVHKFKESWINVTCNIQLGKYTVK
ncbi:hypothetical protein E2C01_067130 [Portunus trituberculatus]|uniref:Uncharacterized protein n=1 Tax=Portunus trituberculatus TaxID=210409 RepID=A0A5B7HST6_PORTR|nr:hypothetical protein [Portunus trituberculatus]